MNKFLLLLIVSFAVECAARADALDTWTKVGTTPYGAFSQVAYGNGMIAALSSTPYHNFSATSGLSTSSDGVNWNHDETYDAPSGLVFGNGVFVKSSWGPDTDGDAGFIHFSTNAIGLTNLDFPQGILNGLYGLAYGNGLFVAAGHLYESDVGTIHTSTDGQAWTLQTTSTSNVFFNGIAYGNGIFVAVGGPYFPPSTNATILTSSNGTNWIVVPISVDKFTSPLKGLTFVNGIFYASKLDTNGQLQFFSSSNGRNWTPTNAPYPSFYLPGAVGSGTYISINSGSNLYTSTDAFNWTLRNPGITNSPTCIVFDGNHFILGCSDGSLLRSGSIIPSLTGQAVLGNGGIQLTLNGGLGRAFALQASPDLKHWTDIFTFTNIESSNQYLDTSATNLPSQFYRAVAQ